MKSKKSFINRKIFFVLALLTASIISSCDVFDFELPEANSKLDTILPSSNFSYESLPGNFMEIKFTNLSSEATTFLWDFGSGSTSTLKDPIFIFEDGEGTYPVTLISSDANGASSMVTIDVLVEMGPVAPSILGAGFEVDADKNFWKADFSRIGTSTSVMQTTTSSGYFEGARGGKFPSDESRLGYQEFTTFIPSTNYILRYKYRMKNNSTSNGVMNVSIVTLLTSWDLATLPSKTIATNAHAETTANVDGLVEGTLQFNSGSNTNLAILLYNEVEEMYIDSFTLEIQ